MSSLMALLKTHLRAPVFEGDENKTRRGQLLNAVLAASFVLCALNLILTLLFTTEHRDQWWGNLVILAIIVMARAALRRGHVNAASAVLISVIWIGITIGTYNHGGLLNPDFSAYVLTILMGGLLLGGRGALLFAVLSMAMGLISLGRLDATFQTDGREEVVSYAIIFIMAVFLLDMADRSIREALARARRHEGALRESELRARHILVSLPAAVLVRSQENDTILFINPAGARLLGAAAPEEISGKTFQEFFTPQTKKMMVERLRKMRAGEVVPPVECTLYRTDRQIIQVELESQPFIYQNMPCVMAIITDISPRKQAQRDLMKAEGLRSQVERERRAIKMKESFTSMVSHEFRTPLSVILSSKGMLERYYDRYDEAQRLVHLDRIGQQVTYMLEMLDDIMLISEGNAGMTEFRPTPLDVADFCRELIHEMPGGADRFRVTNTAPDQRPALDGRLLRRILGNLLSNAVKYSEEGRPIHLDVRYEGQSVIFSVRDEGVGIPPEAVSEVFEPFFRARNVTAIKGTGLGLTIVRNSVTAHGGEITCRSQPGDGTTFEVRLPIAEEADARGMTGD